MAIESKYAGIHIPCGCTVFVGDDKTNLKDVGVIPEDTESSISISYDVTKVNGSKRENVLSYVRNMKANGSFAIYQVNLNILNELTGGLMKLTEVESKEINEDIYNIKDYKTDVFYTLPGQNKTGEKQTIVSVKLGTEALEENVGYKQEKKDGVWGLIILTDNVTEKTAQITYSYTPAAYIEATMGEGVKEIRSKMIRFYKEFGGKRFWVDLFAATMTNGITISFPSSSQENPVSIPVEIEGELEPERDTGEQLVRIHDEIGVVL